VTKLLGASFGLGGAALTAEQERAKEMEDALSWLRTNDLNYDDPDMDDASVQTMSKIKSMVPGALDKDDLVKVPQMESALDWLRNSDDASVKTFNVDDISVSSRKKLGGVGLGTPEEARLKDMENALNWLRSNETDVDMAMDEASVSSYAVGPHQRANDNQNAMNWLQASGSKPAGFDDLSVASRKGPRGPLSAEEQKASAMADALNRLRDGTTDVAGMDDLKSYSNVPGMSFARGAGQAGNITARQMRTFIDESSVASGKGPRGPLSEEERKARAMADALNWLSDGATGGAGMDDIDAYDIDFAQGAGQAGGIRARQMRSGLDDSSVASGMGPRGPLSAEERKARAMADALNRLTRWQYWCRWNG
jgi:hypothetical protein